jgi:hypothetical protein
MFRGVILLEVFLEDKVMNGNIDRVKDKLFLVTFKNGYIKPVIAVTPDHVREIIKEDGKFKLEDITEIKIEQNYYPQNEDFFDV